MKYIITKEFTFEAAHRLIRNYEGKCSNNHGHSYRVKLYLAGDALDEKDMLLDFNETKELRHWIDNNLDHTTILWEEDPMVEMMMRFENRLVVTNKNPTSEHIAELILAQAQRLFENSSVKVHCVEVSETSTSSARVYPAQNEENKNNSDERI